MGKKKVLLVDDIEHWREYKKQLEERLDLDIAYDGEQARQLVSDTKYDLVIVEPRPVDLAGKNPIVNDLRSSRVNFIHSIKNKIPVLVISVSTPFYMETYDLRLYSDYEGFFRKPLSAVDMTVFWDFVERLGS